MRLIAGDAYGLRNDVKTKSPLFYLHVTLQQGATFGLPKEHSERGFYIVKGSVEVSGNLIMQGKCLSSQQVQTRLYSLKENSTLMLIGR
jgi:redox-sensitive bicupin YhaK (pirin superfamily)